VVVLGPGQALLAAVPHPGREATHLLELSLGGAALLLAFVLWLARARVERRLTREEQRIGRSSIALGAGLMAVELPAALPYFAVIAAIVGSDRAVATQLA